MGAHAESIYYAGEAPPENPPKEAPDCYKFERAGGLKEQLQKLKKKYDDNFIGEIVDNIDGSQSLIGERDTIKYFYSNSPEQCQTYQNDNMSIKTLKVKHDQILKDLDKYLEFEDSFINDKGTRTFMWKSNNPEKWASIISLVTKDISLEAKGPIKNITEVILLDFIYTPDPTIPNLRKFIFIENVVNNSNLNMEIFEWIGLIWSDMVSKMTQTFNLENPTRESIKEIVNSEYTKVIGDVKIVIGFIYAKQNLVSSITIIRPK